MREPRPIVDKTIGLALLATIILETAGVVHWAGRTSQRVDQLELNAALTHPINLRLARLEEQMSGARRSLVRIEHDLDIVEESE